MGVESKQKQGRDSYNEPQVMIQTTSKEGVGDAQSSHLDPYMSTHPSKTLWADQLATIPGWRTA